jgi:hypothetical protein
MGRALKVQLTNASSDLIHSFRNLGEDVYRALRDEYDVSLEEIDVSVQEFCVRKISKREIRTVAARVRRIAERHRNLIISVDEILIGDDG